MSKKTLNNKKKGLHEHPQGGILPATFNGTGFENGHYLTGIQKIL
jgi:hypothetical protein